MEFRDLNRQYNVLKSRIDSSIISVIESSRFISGPEVERLEESLAKYVGVRHCITCGNGTDAISIAMSVWNIGKGDAVFVPDFTFFSTAECPADLGATPVFVDVDDLTFNLDPLKLEIAIKKVISDGVLRAKAVIAVDLFGLPADYKKIKKICNKYGLLLLEDSAQGFGGQIDEKKACSFGDISTTSFFPAKPLGCFGDGGAIFTDNDEWADMIRSICVHGKDTSSDDPNSKYNNIRLGRNSRLDTIQAAVLLEKFNAFKEYELNDVNNNALLYQKNLKNTDLILPNVSEGYYSSWAQYTIRLPHYIRRDMIQKSLKANGIPTMIYYAKPLHTQKAFEGSYSEKTANCPITESLCSTVLSLPLDPYKTKAEIEYVTNEIKKYCN